MKTSNPIPQFTFTGNVYEDICNTIGKRPPESAGMIGGDLNTGYITRFHFDEHGKRTGASCSHDRETLDKILEEWNAAGERLMGYPHSHPPGCTSPSLGDERYAAKILEVNETLPYLLIPIVLPAANRDGCQINLFTAVRAGNGVKISQVPYQVRPTAAQQLVTAARELFNPQDLEPDVELFARVAATYELKRLIRSRVMIVGNGGAAAFGEDLVRSGIGEIVLIDPGLVEKCNLATQHYFNADVGQPKVRCLARRLKAVNPHIKVACFVKPLNAISDAKFEKLALAPLSRIKIPEFSPVPPLVTVIVGATDDFYAQARVNRLALKFGLPSVCAQNYQNGVAGEVTFTHPQTTKACHRCILSNRYAAYLERNYKNTVGSAGSPISSTVRINELKFMLVMAILHHGTNHPKWGNLLERIGQRNLIMVRNHPDAEQQLGLTNFTEAFAGTTSGQFLFGDTIFRPQVPEHPATGYARACPDCGGTGDLMKVKGTIQDTREIPR